MSNTDIVLQVQGVSKRFGGLQALTDVGITIRRGQVYGLIGRASCRERVLCVV